ncbi:MAG TPA: hypothetical protein VMZ74_06420 [Ramlibacter sp.]|nr:hypothetical protein [Ramlibacter sp.]
MIKDLPARPLISPASTYTADVSIPTGGLLLTAADVPLIALFEDTFTRIDRISAELQFADDLWDPGETWYSGEFGGQMNMDTSSRSSAALNTLDCSTFFRFADGRFRFNLHCENGTIRLTSMRFVVTGLARPT